MIEFTLHALDYLRRAARRVSEAQRRCGCPRHALAVVYREHDIIDAVVDGGSELNHVPLVHSRSPQPAQGSVAVVRWNPGMPIPESLHEWRAFCERAIANAAQTARGSPSWISCELRASEPSVPDPARLVSCARGEWQREQLDALLGGYAVPAPRSASAAASLANMISRLRLAGARVTESDRHYLYAGPTRGLLASCEWPEPDPDLIPYGEPDRPTLSTPDICGSWTVSWRMDGGVEVSGTRAGSAFELREGYGWGEWSPCRGYDWRWRVGSMLTAMRRAPRAWAPYPIGYAPSHDPTCGYRVPVLVPGWSDAIFVVAPSGPVEEHKFSWRAESVRVLAVVTDAHSTVEDADGIPVIRVRRALGPWVAQQLALERWEMEAAAEELAR